MSGRRNEPARERHRKELKRDYSLTSVPQGELETSGALLGRKLSLSNHFGWVVLGKSKVGDGVFPHLSEFYEKPGPSGRDFQKVTYVLFMDKGPVIDRKTEIKQTQTTITGAEGEPQIVIEEPTPIPVKEKKDKKEKPKRRSKSDESGEEVKPERKRMPKERRKIGEKKKKIRGRYLISEFYFVPKEHRSLSRSTRGTSGDESEVSRGEGRNEITRHPRSRSSKKSTGESGSDGRKKKKKSSRSRSKASSGAGSRGKKKKPKKRTGPDRWQLRAPAGAENFEGSNEREYTETEEEGDNYDDIKSLPKPIDPLKDNAIKPESRSTQRALNTTFANNHSQNTMQSRKWT